MPKAEFWRRGYALSDAITDGIEMAVALLTRTKNRGWVITASVITGMLKFPFAYSFQGASIVQSEQAPANEIPAAVTVTESSTYSTLLKSIPSSAKQGAVVLADLASATIWRYFLVSDETDNNFAISSFILASLLCRAFFVLTNEVYETAKEVSSADTVCYDPCIAAVSTEGAFVVLCMLGISDHVFVDELSAPYELGVEGFNGLKGYRNAQIALTTVGISMLTSVALLLLVQTWLFEGKSSRKNWRHSRSAIDADLSHQQPQQLEMSADKRSRRIKFLRAVKTTIPIMGPVHGIGRGAQAALGIAKLLQSLPTHIRWPLALGAGGIVGFFFGKGTQMSETREVMEDASEELEALETPARERGEPAALSLDNLEPERSIRAPSIIISEHQLLSAPTSPYPYSSTPPAIPHSMVGNPLTIFRPPIEQRHLEQAERDLMERDLESCFGADFARAKESGEVGVLIESWRQWEKADAKKNIRCGDFLAECGHHLLQTKTTDINTAGLPSGLNIPLGLQFLGAAMKGYTSIPVIRETANLRIRAYGGEDVLQHDGRTWNIEQVPALAQDPTNAEKLAEAITMEKYGYMPPVAVAEITKRNQF